MGGRGVLGAVSTCLFDCSRVQSQSCASASKHIGHVDSCFLHGVCCSCPNSRSPSRQAVAKTGDVIYTAFLWVDSNFGINLDEPLTVFLSQPALAHACGGFRGPSPCLAALELNFRLVREEVITPASIFSIPLILLPVAVWGAC